MLLNITFTQRGCCTLTGNFVPGDIARVPSGLADHLVRVARCARYDELPTAVEATNNEPIAEPLEVKPTRGRGRPRKVR